MTGVRDPYVSYKIKKAWQQTYSGGVPEIARVMGVSVDTVRDHMQRMGLETRKKNKHPDPDIRYSTVDNAVTAAFRAVWGRCPFNGEGEVIPKRQTALDL